MTFAFAVPFHSEVLSLSQIPKGIAELSIDEDIQTIQQYITGQVAKEFHSEFHIMPSQIQIDIRGPEELDITDMKLSHFILKGGYFGYQVLDEESNKLTSGDCQLRLFEEIFALKQRLGEDVNSVVEAPRDRDSYTRKLAEALKESEQRVGELAEENERLRRQLNSR
jgi:hypothetical protein